MGYKEFDIKIPVFNNNDELKKIIYHKTGIKDFSFQILKKSIDARQKKNICWQFRVGLVSDEIKNGTIPIASTLNPEYKKRSTHVLIVGTGPAGIFSAFLLAMSGIKVTLIERGSKIKKRKESIDYFEKSCKFDPCNNYSFGEGGAGTFSDGKLTSRTKSISQERNFIYKQFIEASAPDEINYMTHPHLGSDNLFRITLNIRKRLENLGCRFIFDTMLEGLKIESNRVITAITSAGNIDADYFILAIGQSAFETYRMLIRCKVPFHTKNFALGFRAEHMQEIINIAQWGVSSIPGIKAAEYRLTSQCTDNTPVYSFCMCPGGKVVPATAYAHTNVVNGMSNYLRDSQWANAAVVAAINLEKYHGKSISALEALDWLEQIESTFFRFSNSYNAPASLIANFLTNKNGGNIPQSSYPFKLIEADFRDILPKDLIYPLKEGLKKFCKQLKGYETGVILGLESKTSSPLQAERDPVKLYSGYSNLYIAGEGSGWASGIISSAADGIKIARQVLVT